MVELAVGLGFLGMLVGPGAYLGATRLVDEPVEPGDRLLGGIIGALLNTGIWVIVLIGYKLGGIILD